MGINNFMLELPNGRAEQLIALSKKTNMSVTNIIKNALYEKLDREQEGA